MEGVNAWLHASSIPRPLKHKIRAFYSGEHGRLAAIPASPAARLCPAPCGAVDGCAVQRLPSLLGLRLGHSIPPPRDVPPQPAVMPARLPACCFWHM